MKWFGIGLVGIFKIAICLQNWKMKWFGIGLVGIFKIAICLQHCLQMVIWNLLYAYKIFRLSKEIGNDKD